MSTTTISNGVPLSAPLPPESGTSLLHDGFLARGVYGLSRSASMLLLAAVLFSINYEVVSRSLFGSPTIWTTEYSTYFVVAIVFLGAAFAVARDSHVRLTLLLDMLQTNRRRHLELAGAWCEFVLIALVSWKAADFVRAEMFSGARDFGLMATPQWAPLSAVAIGYAMLFVAQALYLRKLAGHVSALRSMAGGGALAACAALLCGSALGLFMLKPVSGAIATVVAILVASITWSGWVATLRLVAFASVPVAAYYLSNSASLGWQSAALLVSMLYLLLTGVRVAFVLGLLGLLGVIFWLPAPTIGVLAERSWTAVRSFELSAIPMFVLMGALLVKSDASSEMFNAMRTLFGRIRGGFAFASIGAAGVFAAVSGSSLATAATLGRVAGPEMLDHGYSPKLAFGVLAAGGTLGIMIPPSIAMIVYGSLAGVPVTNLFIGGIIPGIVLMVLFSLVVLGWILLDPKSAPSATPYTLREKIIGLKGTAPFLILIVAVLGTLYLGIATPTEAGAVGTVAALLICHWRGKLTWRTLLETFEETALVTSFLLLIAVGASQMGYVLDFLSMPAALVNQIKSLGLSSGELLLMLVLIYLVLGMFVESISMVLMTLPVVMPLVHAMGWDPVWFGIVLVLLVEIGLITAPVGMILFVLEGVAGGRAKLKDISLGAMPFVVIMLMAIALFFWWPELVTWLPRVMAD
jgi:tripartite ATP-independent transporter DctM subunit